MAFWVLLKNKQIIRMPKIDEVTRLNMVEYLPYHYDTPVLINGARNSNCDLNLILLQRKRREIIQREREQERNNA